MNAVHTITPIQLAPAVDRFCLSGEVRLWLSATDNESYCSVGVHLFSSDMTLQQTLFVGLTKEEADAWGADDSILLDLVLTKTGWAYQGLAPSNDEGV
jgi:hypothetical protein